jgi:hypothetical protein
MSSVWLVVVAGSVLVAGCSSDSSAPSSFLAFIPGPAPTIYAGSIVDSVAGTGTLKVSLNSAGGLISGNWDMSFAGKADPTYTISGPESTAYQATITTCKTDQFGESCTSKCAFHFTGTLTNSSLSGTYSATSDQSCLGRSGTVNATKQ